MHSTLGRCTCSGRGDRTQRSSPAAGEEQGPHALDVAFTHVGGLEGVVGSRQLRRKGDAPPDSSSLFYAVGASPASSALTHRPFPTMLQLKNHSDFSSK